MSWHPTSPTDCKEILLRPQETWRWGSVLADASGRTHPPSAPSQMHETASKINATTLLPFTSWAQLISHYVLTCKDDASLIPTHHGEIPLPDTVAATLTQGTRSLQRIATTFSAVQWHMVLMPAHTTPAINRNKPIHKLHTHTHTHISAAENVGFNTKMCLATFHCKPFLTRTEYG